MATLQKSSGDLFRGDPKQWPIFIQTVKSMVHDITPFNAQRISLLRSMLHADLQATFAQILSSPLTYQQALQDLWNWYGRPHLVVREYIRDLRSIVPFKEGDVTALGNFQQRIHGAICSLQASGYGHELHSSIALADLVEKLPRQLASRWGKHVHKLVVKNSTSAYAGPDLQTFDAWLADTVMAERYASRPSLPSQPTTVASRAFSFGRRSAAATPAAPLPTISAVGSPTVTTSIRALTTGQGEDVAAKATRDRTGCGVCNEERGHSLTGRNAFMAMSPSERLNVVLDLANCFRCLGRNHASADCKKQSIICTAIGCGAGHHPLLHGAEREGVTHPRAAGMNKDLSQFCLLKLPFSLKNFLCL